MERILCKNNMVFAISAVVFHSCFFEPSFIANFTLLCHTSKKSKYKERKKKLLRQQRYSFYFDFFSSSFQNHSIIQNDSLRNKGYNGLFSTQPTESSNTHALTHAPQGFCKIFFSLLFTFSILLLFFIILPFN